MTLAAAFITGFVSGVLTIALVSVAFYIKHFGGDDDDDPTGTS